METKSPRNLQFTYVHLAEENHGSIPHLGIYKGLETIFADWKMPLKKYDEGLSAIDEHYKNISEKFGYEMKTPELVINLLGYKFFQNQQYEKAIEVFKENVKRFPASANVYDSLGETYEKNGQLKLAKQNYEKACELAKKDDPNFEIFHKNLQRLQK
jgi:tetratricopeptide (TPR) repeat protein